MLNDFKLNENINNQRGQATVEYLFLAVLTLAVLTVLSAQVYRPLGSFVENYMGSYLQCLLDVGELPKLGSNNQASVSVCEEEYKPFSLASGRAPKDNRNSNGSGDGNENSSKNNNARNQSINTNGVSGNGNNSLGGSRRQNTNSNAGAGADGKDSQANETTAIAESKFIRSRGYSVSQGGAASVRSSTVEYGFEAYSNYQKSQRKKQQNRSRKVATLPEGESQGSGPRISIVKPPTTINAENNTKIDWSFGKIIKLSLIILIIIVILFFVLNQLNQISKSLEKS